MLSTPDLKELPEKFSGYFGRAVKILMTGHWFDVTLTAEQVSANTTEEQTFTVTGLITSDIIIVQKPTHQAGLGIVNARVSAANTLAITYMNATASPITPTSEEYTILALRREKE
jgi:hypothetical protein